MQRFENLWTAHLSDRSEVSVNLNTGNLILHSTDVHLAQVGTDLDLGRYYNSRTAYTGGPGILAGIGINRLGAGWTFSTGNDVWLLPIVRPDGQTNMALAGPSGYTAIFPPSMGPPTSGAPLWARTPRSR